MANPPPPELQSATDVLKCGYLRKQKTTHKRYFVLRAPDDSCAAGRLEYYESERKFRHKSAPKRAVSLDSCFNISKRADARNKFMVALYTKDEYLAVAAENEPEQDAWYRAITELHARGKAMQQQCSDHHHHHHHHHHPHQQLQQQQQPSLYPHAESGGESGGSTHAGDDVYGAIAPSSAFKEVWQVNLKPRGLGQTRSMFGVYRLCLSSRKISFVKLNSEKPDVTLQLMNVRRCGHSESFFFIEVGRSAVTGPGEFWMQVEDCVVAQNMHETILEAMKAMSEFSEFRPRSKSHSASSSNPISVPPRRHLNSLPPSQTGLSRRSRTESANSTHGASSPAGGNNNNNPASAATTTITNIISHSSRHPLNGGVGGAASGHNFRARTSSEGERTILTSRPSSVTGSPVSVSPTPPRLQQQQQQQLNQQGIRGCLGGRTSSRLQAAPTHSRYVTVPAPGASQPPSSAVSPVSCASSTSPSSSGPSSGRGSSASDALLLLYVKVNSGGLGGGGASASGSPSDGGFASSSDEYGSSPVDARRHQGLVHRSATPESLSRTPPPIREEQDDDGHNLHHHHHHQMHQQQVNNYISMGKSCAQNGHHHHHNHHHHQQQQQLHREVLLARRASQDENASAAEGTSDLSGVVHRKRTYSSCTSPPPPPPPVAQSTTGVQQQQQQQQQQRKPLDDYALMNAGSLTSSGSGSSYTGSSYTSRSASPRPPAGPSTPQNSQAAHLQRSYPEDYGEIHVGSCQRPGATCKDDGYMPMSPGVAPVPTSSSSSSCSSSQSIVSSSTTATSSSMTLSTPVVVVVVGGGPSDDYVPMSPKSVSAPQEILNPRRRQEITDPSGYMVMSPGTNNGSCSPECSPYMKMWSSSKLSVCSADGKGGGDAGCEYMNMSPGLVAGTPPDYFFTPTSAEPPKVNCYYYSLPRSFKPGLRKNGDGSATAASGAGGGARFSPGNLTERQLFGGDKSSSTSSDSLGHDPDQPVASGSSPTASGGGGGITKAEPRKVQQQQGMVRPTRLSLGGLKSSTLPRTYECPAEPVSPGEYVNIEFGDVQTAQAVVDAQRRLSSATRLAARANYSIVPDWSSGRNTTTSNAAAAVAAANSVVSPLAAARGNPAGASYGARPVQNGNAGSDYMSASNVGGLNYGVRVNPNVGVDYASLHMGLGCAPLGQETDGDYTEMRFGVTAPSTAPLGPPSNHSNLEGSKGLTSPTSRLNRLSLMDQMTAAYPVPNPDHGAKVIRADAQGRRRHSSETFSSTTTASAALGSGGVSPAMPTSTSLLSPSFSSDANRLGSASFESVYLRDAAGGPAGDCGDHGGMSRESGFENGLNYVALELSSEECQRAAAVAAAATAASTAGLDGARANAKGSSTSVVDSGAYASIDFARSDGGCPPAQES
ncbi:LOW QUALITY PROTEIN: insulin receptor substrate 1-B-like [Lampetra planeri]